MNFLIDLYDNSLIYHPNIFFPLFLLFSVLGTILLIETSFFLIRESIKVAKEIRVTLSKIKIKKRIRIKISTPKFPKLSFHIGLDVWDFIIKAKNIFKSLNSQTEKIITKIKKEILID